MSKVWLIDTVRGRLRCLSCLGSTGLITGDGTGMADTVLWVGSVSVLLFSTLDWDCWSSAAQDGWPGHD